MGEGSLNEIQRQAYQYLDKITSVEVVGPFILGDITYNKAKFVEAIVLLHARSGMSEHELSHLTDYLFTKERLDIVTDFFLQPAFANENKSSGRRWVGKNILSKKQMAHRRGRESLTIMDVEYV